MIIRLSLATLAFLCFLSPLHADILVLKNGEKKEGQILSESPDAVRMRYRLTPKIWDEKDFPRADIDQIIKQRPEEVAFDEQNLRDTLPTRDMMTADEYERLIQDRLRTFINQYPGTPEAEKVEAMIGVIQEEKQKVVSGQLKVDGKWLTSDEARRDSYNIDANRARREIEKAAESPRWEDWVTALRLFDRFGDATNGFPGSTHYPATVPLILELMQKLETSLQKMIREQPFLQKSQEDSLKTLIEPDLSRTKAALDNALKKWKDEYESDKRSRVKWLTPFKLDLPSLQESQKVLSAERLRLQSLDLPTLTRVNEQLVTVQRYLADNNAEGAEAALESAKRIVAEKALTQQNNPAATLMTQLTTRVNNLKNELRKKQPAQTSFSQGSSAIAGNAGPLMDDRVAKALAAAQGGAIPTATDETPETTSADAPPAAEATPAAPGHTPPAATPAAPATTPATTPPTPPVTPPAVTPPAAAQGSEFPYMLIAGAGALLLVLLLAMAAQKKKKQQED